MSDERWHALPDNEREATRARVREFLAAGHWHACGTAEVVREQMLAAIEAERDRWIYNPTTGRDVRAQPPGERRGIEMAQCIVADLRIGGGA